MKKIIILSAICIILSGCSVWGNTENTDLQTYQNEGLGISFQYPTTLGKPWENNYKGIELFALKFMDKNNQPINLELASADYETLRTCDDILSKGFNDSDRMPKGCETLNVDNHTIVILTFSASKSVHFQTKKGVWSLYATEENLYEDLIKIAKSIKYLK